MTGAAMKIPKNVLWFEVLLYLSLTLDALSVAFQDRTPSKEMTESMITVATVMAAGLILLLVYFVWLAAQKRKNWPRWALVASLVLSVISPPSFRDGPKDQTRNLEIPGSMLRIAPE